LTAKRCGTGPPATSPSNIVVRRGHSAASTVGTVSLGGKWLFRLGEFQGDLLVIRSRKIRSYTVSMPPKVL
jgi:hypothetical protein